MYGNQSKTPSIYQFKVNLRGISPLIWRRFLVGSDSTLFQLHSIIQILFSWEDGYHYSFRIHGKSYGDTANCNSAGTIILTDLLLHPNECFQYTYNFISNWEHKIRFERLLSVDNSYKYPVCIAGNRASPPDHLCNGVHEYMAWLQKRESWSSIYELQSAIKTIYEASSSCKEGHDSVCNDSDSISEAMNTLKNWAELAPQHFNRQHVNASLQEKLEKGQ